MTDVSERYARQTLLTEVGAEGQRRFAAAHVQVAGRGTAARVCALYLAGAGVGRLTVAPALVDDVRALNPEVDVRVARDGESSAAVDVAGHDVDVGAAAALAILKRLLRDAPR